MYGKFFASTFTGSLYGAGPDIFAVWAYVIAHAIESRVELNPAVLGHALGTDPERVKAAITFLCSPDTNSRNKNEDGRRLIPEGSFQYLVVNHEIYRTIRNEDDRRAYNRDKQRESRAKRRNVKQSVNDSQSLSAMSAHTDTDTDTDTREERTTQERIAPHGLDLPSWERWSEYRSAIRKPIKPPSVLAAQRKLAAFGADQAAVVEQSIANGWQGLFALREPDKHPESPVERVTRQFSDRMRGKYGLGDVPERNNLPVGTSSVPETLDGTPTTQKVAP